jgi:hypothetical protein
VIFAFEKKAYPADDIRNKNEINCNEEAETVEAKGTIHPWLSTSLAIAFGPSQVGRGARVEGGMPPSHNSWIRQC